MASYTEEEIRQALWDYPVALDVFLNRLRKEKNDHAHDFTDPDMVTVKEIRENSPAAGIVSAEVLLRLISEHREPHYPYASAWKSSNGVIWVRASGNTWLKPGDSRSYPDDFPSRPLRRMDVVS